MSAKSRKWLRFRVASILILFLVLYVALASRALQLQIVSGETLKALADGQHKKSLTLNPERRFIFDRNGQKLAATLMADSVYVDPSNVEEQGKVSSKLSSILGVKRQQIAGALVSKGRFRWIARQVSPIKARRIRALKLKGVHLIEEPRRFYPHREMACHLLGFAGLDSTGLEGLEAKYDKYLKGVPKEVVWGRDANGQEIYLSDNAVGMADDESCSLFLTIDSKIQYIVESQLKKAFEDTGARAGNVIVMDPRTGEVLAMASEPQFNPNDFSLYLAEVRKNRPVIDCFDPGSVFKPFVAAAVIEEGLVTETDMFDCENGSYAVGNRVIHDAQDEKFNKLSLSEILKYSSNIGAVKVAQRLGREKLYHYITTFGFGSKTGIDLPGESSGLLRDPKDWADIDFATIAFGQGVSVTSIQLVTAMSAIANDGVLMKPHVVQCMVDKKGRVVKKFEPVAVRRAISPETSHKITSILTNVVEGEGGTGENARIVNLSVAGKTGTSQKFDFDMGNYSAEKVQVSFIGFFPAEDPQMVILVVLDEPKIHRWGGSAAAPVFRKISEQILRCSNKSMELRDVTAGNEGATIIQASTETEIISRNNEWDKSTIPDFQSMSIREVLRISQSRGIDVRIAGSGWAVSQNPIPGARIEENKPCYVLFDMGV
ncbi:MAG: penicillin-binding transpeptidase domain-containing protein [Thermodesulfobacteriota bacterium]|nr:penicillin-binding transpeptidase domain-containing protein [Thermodesulfobacteriota bacterium]